MADALFRQWMMLQALPRAPQKISVEDLHAKLEAAGIDVTRRSVQRDLNALAAIFPIESDERKPAGWRFTKEAQLISLPGMDPQTALAFRVVEDHVAHLLPRSSKKALEPHFTAARKVLAAISAPGGGLGSWLDRVRVIPRSFPLLPPQVDGASVDAVYQAVFENRALTARYRARNPGKKETGLSVPRAASEAQAANGATATNGVNGVRGVRGVPSAVDAKKPEGLASETTDDGKGKEITLHPLGLVFKDSVVYLLATAFEYADVRQYAVHRFSDVELLDEPAKPKARDFDIDRYIEDGELGFLLSKEKRKVRALFDPAAAPSVVETPLCKDQKVTVQDDGRVLIEAELPDTVQLRAFLDSFGPGVKLMGA